MTLIVGVMTGSQVQLLSDTRITHPDVTQIEETPGRLKLITLSPLICVGYAGQANLAIDHLKNTPIDARSSFERVIAHLRQESRSDFLVAESQSLRLATVKNGSVEELGLGYVGDDDAWEAFTVARENASPPENAGSDLTLLSSVLDAFGRVVSDESHPTVAGFSMRVMSRGDGFHYSEMAGMHMVGINESLNEATAPKYSDAAAGAYSYTLLTPREPGRAVVAVHLHQGRFGFVYAPLAHDRPVKVTEVDHEGLRAFVKQHYGVDVDGLRIGAASFGVPGRADKDSLGIAARSWASRAWRAITNR